jgi:hypothetical protein
MTTVRTKLKAYLSNQSELGPQDLMTDDGIARLFFSNLDMAKYGYTLVGEAEITVALIPTNEMVENKVQALRNEAAAVRAAATATVTRIESQIQNLLAISYDEPSSI